VARDKTLEAAALAVGRLVAGAPDAAADPLIEKLRGPRTLGDVIGDDVRWVWSEFTPRLGPTGENIETGEERVLGQRADIGRVPGALWGERPGEAWYVLETLARYRGGDPDAPLVPWRSRARGTGAAHVRGHPHGAGLGETPLALELEEVLPGPQPGPGVAGDEAASCSSAPASGTRRRPCCVAWCARTSRG
jgi:hypothetical protein